MCFLCKKKKDFFKRKKVSTWQQNCAGRKSTFAKEKMKEVKKCKEKSGQNKKYNCEDKKKKRRFKLLSIPIWIPKELTSFWSLLYSS